MSKNANIHPELAPLSIEHYNHRIMTLPDSGVILSRLIILLICFPVHEMAHAYAANAFGDDTPRLYGRLSFNPLIHLDLLGSLLLMISGFGWAKPVPINPFTLTRRSKAAPMLVSLAGPGSNILMGILAALVVRLGIMDLPMGTAVSTLLSTFLFQFIFINLLLAVLNLIPVAPLDGEKVLEFFLPRSWSLQWEKIRPYGPAVLLVLFVAAPFLGFDIIGNVLYPLVINIMRMLLG